MKTINTKEDIVTRIVDAEWEMFHNVPNIGGTASCQQDRKTFEVNRTSQAMSWSEGILESYMNDLIEAKSSGRNLLTEKYGRMMESTSPEEYAQIKRWLPSLSREASLLIEEIIRITLKWDRAMQEKYPYIVRRSRPLYSTEDTRSVTSMETYLRGELATYSLKTLKLYCKYARELESANINMSENTLEYLMKSYGFKSVQEANEKLGHEGNK